MSPDLEFPRPIVFDRDYWLCRCQGFRVDSSVGRVGSVEEVRFGSRLDRPDTIVVSTGLLGISRLLVPVSEVEQIVPREQRLVLSSTPKVRRTKEQLRRLRNHLAATLGVR
jgi:hypothetical protein